MRPRVAGLLVLVEERRSAIAQVITMAMTGLIKEILFKFSFVEIPRKFIITKF